MNILAFDIETVPDVAFGRELYDLHDLSDKDVARVMYTKRREKTGDSEFLAPHMHRVAAISVLYRSDERLKLWSLGQVDDPEPELLRHFFRGIEKYSPTLVSWNGTAFDLPVLHYRALRHGIGSRLYWESGDGDKEFRWNNYQNRYHERHTDLIDVLANFQHRAHAPLHEIATLLGLPGKLGMQGGEVWNAYLDGRLGAIRDYCETDVLNTWLIYLRWLQVRGVLDDAQLQHEQDLLREYLLRVNQPHLTGFLKAWNQAERT